MTAREGSIATALRDGLDEHARVVGGMGPVLDTARDVALRICDAFAEGGRVYTFGNGGSAADAQHLAAELIGRYRRDRRALPAASLAVDPSVVTCIANDFGGDRVFARQVEGLARSGDVVVGFTTSGRSANVLAGLEAARAAGATTVLFGGGDGGPAMAHADLALLVPSETTARVQEMHLLLLHLISEAVDAWAAGETPVAGEEGAVAP